MNIPITCGLAMLTALAIAAPIHAPIPDAAVPTDRAVTVQPRASLLVTGQVRDSVTGQPVEGVVMSMDGLERGILTGPAGRYVLRVPAERASAEELTIRASGGGYDTSERTVRTSTQADGVLLADFMLSRRTVDRDPALGHQDSMRRLVSARSRPAQAGPVVVAELHASGRPVHRYAPPGGFEREQYARIVENDFRSAVDAPLSTFSIDVDRASYSNVRRFLMRESRLPPTDAVQIEEMMNYFPYDYDLPRGDDPVGVTTELGEAPWAEGHRLLRVGVATRPVDTEDLPPSNLVFLIDVSGSMQSANKLALVKRSLRLLVNELRPDDRVSMVVYAGAAGLVLEPTSGSEKTTILDALDRLEAGGSTAGGQGLRLAYDVARRSFLEGGNNRVILATDGDFNVGESSDAAMTRLVEARREEGTFLTVLGFGTGNLQATKMQQMAQNGNGNYAYIDGMREARKVLVGEMGGTILTVAKDVKVQVEFNPAHVRAYRLMGYENRILADEDFNDDTKDAGEIGAGHTVTALYEIVPVGSDSPVRGGSVDPLRYRTPDGIDRSEASGELAFVKVRYKAPDGDESRLLSVPVAPKPAERVSEDLGFASAVAGFGMLLRKSEHRGTVHAQQILDLAASSIGEDPHGYRREFVDMVRTYRLLTDGPWTEPGWEEVRR